jgi:Leucine-rich repeat (LRR) protein
MLAKTLAKPTCDWKTFDKTQANITIINCSATTIDSNFLGTHNITVDKNNNLIELKLETGLTLIEDFTFNTAYKLTELNLQSNDIAMISKKAFSGLASLEILRLSYNKIDHLHKNTFSELIKLKYLYIYNNKFTKFDFACLQKNLNLMIVDLEANALVEFETSSPSFRLNNMYALYLNKNLLAALPLDNLPELPHLQKFYIESNRLTKIDVEQIKLRFPGLTTFTFGSNKWDCFYLIEMIENIKTLIPGIEIDPELSGDLLDSNFEHFSNCLSCPTLDGNQSQIDVLERQLNESLDQMRQYKLTAEDRCHCEEVSSFSSIIIMLFLILFLLVVLIFMLYFYLIKNKVNVAKEADETIDGSNYMEMLCN